MVEHTNQSGDNDPPKEWPPRLTGTYLNPQAVWEALGPMPFGLIAHEKFDFPQGAVGGAPLKMWSLLWQFRHDVTSGQSGHGGPVIRSPTTSDPTQGD